MVVKWKRSKERRKVGRKKEGERDLGAFPQEPGEDLGDITTALVASLPSHAIVIANLEDKVQLS